MKPPTKRAKKKKENPFTHEVRTKVPAAIGKKIEKDAASRGLKSTDIVRTLLMERYAEITA